MLRSGKCGCLCIAGEVEFVGRAGFGCVAVGEIGVGATIVKGTPCGNPATGCETTA
jgi:hypothetical protein